MATAVQSARERARQELVAAIKDAATRQLAEVGAAALSLRAVARELGMVSSAVYRYVPNRDALLTLMILDAYDDLGESAERADRRASRSGADPGARWLAVARAVRRWAKANAHRWALVYGSPVPGYAAPPDTVPSALRLTQVMVGVLRDAVATGEVGAPERALPGASPMSGAAREVAGSEISAELAERGLLLVVGLVGAVSYELFGHLKGGVDDADAWFARATAISAEAVGLRVDVG